MHCHHQHATRTFRTCRRVLEKTGGREVKPGGKEAGRKRGEGKQERGGNSSGRQKGCREKTAVNKPTGSKGQQSEAAEAQQVLHRTFPFGPTENADQDLSSLRYLQAQSPYPRHKRRTGESHAERQSVSAFFPPRIANSLIWASSRHHSCFACIPSGRRIQSPASRLIPRCCAARAATLGLARYALRRSTAVGPRVRGSLRMVDLAQHAQSSLAAGTQLSASRRGRVSLESIGLQGSCAS